MCQYKAHWLEGYLLSRNSVKSIISSFDDVLLCSPFAELVGDLPLDSGDVGVPGDFLLIAYTFNGILDQVHVIVYCLGTVDIA